MRRALFALILACSACGGDPSPAKTPVVDNTPPPPEVMALVVHVGQSQDENTRAIANMYKWALARSGFRVVEDQGEPHDVEIQLASRAVPVQSVWHMQVNGVERQKLDVHVIAAIVGLQPQARIDMFQSDFEMTQGADPEAGEIGRMVLAFAKSPNLARWAKNRGASEPSDDDDTAHSKPPSGADDSDWYKLKPVACKIPLKLDACDPIRAYLVKWPKGGHAQEARNTLDAAEPALEKLQKDDNDWQAVRPDDCRKKKTRDACAGVEVYLRRYPAGLHADEAKKLIGN